MLNATISQISGRREAAESRPQSFSLRRRCAMTLRIAASVRSWPLRQQSPFRPSLPDWHAARGRASACARRPGRQRDNISRPALGPGPTPLLVRWSPGLLRAEQTSHRSVAAIATCADHAQSRRTRCSTASRTASRRSTACRLRCASCGGSSGRVRRTNCRPH